VAIYGSIIRKIKMMKLDEALIIAEKLKKRLEPYCVNVEIAGSIRRKKPEVKDIEIVAIPKPYEIGLFRSGIAEVLDDYPIIKGHLPCSYTQRMLPEGIKVDVFFANEVNWGYIFALRTGCADFSRWLVVTQFKRLGYKCERGFVYNKRGDILSFSNEEELFKTLKLPYIPPESRISGRLYECLKHKRANEN